jgi:hypothetical protein
MIAIRHLLPLVLVPAAAALAALDINFSNADLNKDSFVDIEELQRAGVFAAHDLDGNDALEPDQLGNPELFAAWDTDANGSVEREEFYDGIMAFADINGDNKLGSLEFRRALIEWRAGDPVERKRW